MISYRFWQQDLGGDPNVLGRTLRVDSVPYTVVGVAPNDFRFWWRAHDLWVPVTLNAHERDYRDLVVIARLAGTKAAAASELSVIARSLAAAFPKNDRGWTLQLEDLKERLLSQTFRLRLLVLCGAVGTGAAPGLHQCCESAAGARRGPAKGNGGARSRWARRPAGWRNSF